MDDGGISANQSGCILFGVAVFDMVIVRFVFEWFNCVFELKKTAIWRFLYFQNSVFSIAHV